MKKLLILCSVFFLSVPAFGNDGHPLTEGIYTVDRFIGPGRLQLKDGTTVRLIDVNTSYADTDQGKKKETMNFVGTLVKSGKKIKIAFDTAAKSPEGEPLVYAYLPILYEITPEVLAMRRTGAFDAFEKALLPPDKSFQDGSNYLLFLNAYIISMGYSRPKTVTPQTKHAALLEALYQEAINNKRGLWQ